MRPTNRRPNTQIRLRQDGGPISPTRLKLGPIDRSILREIFGANDHRRSIVERDREREGGEMRKDETVKLISAEGFEFVIAKEAAMVSHTIRNMLTSPGDVPSL